MKIKGTLPQEVQIDKYEQSRITIETLQTVFDLTGYQLFNGEIHDTIHRRDGDSDKGFVSVATEEQKAVFLLVDKIKQWGYEK